MYELLIFIAAVSGFLAIAILSAFVMEAADRHYSTPYWERKARKYERKADRLRSIRVFLNAFPFPFTDVTSHNLAVFTDRYMNLAEKCRKELQ